MACHMLATVDMVQDRLFDPLTDDEKRVVRAKIEDASALAIYLSAGTWEKFDLVPMWVKSIVANAVVRWVQNPEGIVRSASDGKSVTLDTGGKGGDVWLPDEDIAALRALHPNYATPGLGTVPSYHVRHEGMASRDGWVPTTRGEFFPLFAPARAQTVGVVYVEKGGPLAPIVENGPGDGIYGDRV